MHEDKFLSVEIGGTKLQVALGYGSGTIIKKEIIPVYPAKSAREILSKLKKPLLDLIEDDLPKAIGVGYGGPVNRFEGSVICSHQIEGWEGFHLKKWFEETSSVKTIIENDANVAALGEALSGAGKESASTFYITLGSGVGAGFVKNKKIFHGEHPTETEFGHIRIDKSGETVESRCSGWSVDNQLIAAYKKTTSTELKVSLESYHQKTGHKGGEATVLRELINKNNAEALRIMEELSENLAFALSHVVHLLNPGIVTFGGGISKLGSALTEKIELKLRRYTMEAISEIPSIKTSELGDEVVLCGGLILASQYHHQSDDC